MLSSSAVPAFQYLQACRTFLGSPMVSGKELDLTLHRAMRAEGEGSLASRYPREMLMLLDRLVPEAPHHSPYGLGDALEEIAAGAPDLRDDERWRRLEMIARGG
jgi:hypothetical protein